MSEPLSPRRFTATFTLEMEAVRYIDPSQADAIIEWIDSKWTCDYLDLLEVGLDEDEPEGTLFLRDDGKGFTWAVPGDWAVTSLKHGWVRLMTDEDFRRTYLPPRENEGGSQ